MVRPPVLYVAISCHGFGHATRVGSVVGAVLASCPETRVIVAGQAPRWLLSAYIGGPFEQRSVRLDAGVVQPDSQTIDTRATLRRIADVRSRQHDIVAEELECLERERADIVLADIPPLAAVIADAAGVPCWMIGNFGWDYIYEAWGPVFRPAAEWVADCYAMCDRLYRLPFHEPMGAFPSVVDAGLTGGSPRYDPESLRARFGLRFDRERTALVTFGGHAVGPLPYANAASHPDWQFIVFDDAAPDLANIVKIPGAEYRPVDLMPLAGRLIGKPGYSTFSEACRAGLAIVTTPRPLFAEAAVLIEGIERQQPHQILDAAELLEGDWSFLDRPVDPPLSEERAGTDGTERIARDVVAHIEGRCARVGT